jgi:hypothetical protein
MSKAAVFFCLFTATVSLAIIGCHASKTQLASNAAASPLLKEIHVDQHCRILHDDTLASDGAKTDSVICHLESVKSSRHVEEAVDANAKQRTLVTISEQDYLLQNVTKAPIAFVVEHPVPDGWKIDSDPEPTEMVGSVAHFRVMAQPGQIVRLHVGERQAKRLAPDSAS